MTKMATILDAFPRVRLASLPTPLDFCRGSPSFSRGREFSSNRTTRLDWRWVATRSGSSSTSPGTPSRWVDTLVTIGGVQSNHARQTAAAAARLGLQCELVLPRVVPRSGEEYEQSGNVLLDRLLGARLRILPAEQNSSSVLERVAEELRAGGRKPYVIPTGGSTAHGALGYVQALFELLEQIREGDVRV